MKEISPPMTRRDQKSVIMAETHGLDALSASARYEI